MKTTFLAILPLPPRALSPNKTSSEHWRHRHKATKSYRQTAWAIFREAKPVGWHPTNVRVDMDYYVCNKSLGYRPRDVANAMAALKAAIDGMVDAQIAWSDARRSVQWGHLNLYGTEHELKMAPADHHVTLDGCVVLTVTALDL